ncbi:MAG: hypothetical protein KJ571_11950 [Bacteroidetes bacterium]|nr:hypothetical protein [Bacteroidota bacterium]
MYSANLFESEVFSKLTEKRNLYDPLNITEIKPEYVLNENDKKGKVDGLIQLNYLDKKLILIIEIKNRTAPQIVKKGVESLKTWRDIKEFKEYIPTIVVPYLSDSVIDILKPNKISGLDLNGNYFIISDDIIAIRLDKKNKYKENVPIKDIYGRNSSLVGKFLLRENKRYLKVSDIYNSIQELGGDIALSTVSKVLTALQEQLIISKGKDGIRLIQPDKLLSNLRMNYSNPGVYKTLRVRLPESMIEAKELLNKYFLGNWIWAGETSATRYASTTSTNEFTVYCKGVDIPEEFMLKYIDIRYYNCTFLLLPKSEEYVFFDSQEEYASRLQTYLELSQLDKREKEIAQDIEKDILNGFSR